MATPEVDAGGAEVLRAFVVTQVVVVLNKGVDLLREVAGQVVVFKQDAALECLVPTLDLALCLGVIWGASDMVHLLIFQPICQLTRGSTRTIIAEQARLVQDRRLIAARGLHRQVKRVGHVAGFHCCAKLPCDNVSAVVAQDRREVEPAPADDLQVGEVGLPELVRSRGHVLELVGC